MKVRRLIKQMNRMRRELLAYWKHGKRPSFATPGRNMSRRLAYSAAEACEIEVRMIRRYKAEGRKQ